MELYYATQKLQQMCDTDQQRRAKFGPDMAKQIARRQLQLRTAATLEDLRDQPGRCHELTGDLSGHLAMRISANQRLVFKPNGWPAKEDGGLDWPKVESVVIVEVCDYH